MNKDDIIFKIGTIRRDANLSARALSTRIDLNEGYINRLESKKDFLPSMEVFFRILEECNYTAEKFFCHDSNNFERDMEILERIKALPDEKKDALLTFLK